MEKIENNNYLDSENFFEDFVTRLEDLATKPDSNLSDTEIEAIGKFRETQKLPSKFKGMISMIGQDLRLTPQQIDILLEKYLD